MKQLFISLLFVSAGNICFGQLQIKPPGEDTMPNSRIAEWYTNQYRRYLELSDAQAKKVYEILLANKNRVDSLRISPKVTTEELMKNYLLVDEKLKTVFTDKQYYDYLKTSDIHWFEVKK